jgi:hypothetical protein
MKHLFTFCLFLISTGMFAQDIVGKWQLVKETTCVEDEVGPSTEEEEELVEEMKSYAGSTNQVIEFKDNNTATESTKIINRRKTYNSNALMYKFTGTDLHILDKKSKLIIDSFTVEQLSGDSLIITNSSRACETRVFVKIK